MSKFIDLTGRKFGRLTPINMSKKRASNKGIIWECLCECGNIACVASGDLVRKDGCNTESCGCLASESHAESVIRRALPYMTCYEGTKISLLTQRVRKDNRTGTKGVCWNQRRNRYIAYIEIKGKRKYLGYYEKLEDAIKARKLAEEELFHPIIEEYSNLKGGQPIE